MGKFIRLNIVLRVILIALDRGETVSIDIVGPLPVDGKSHRYIVTILDVYSRYLLATPVKNHTASTVSRCLYESVVAYFGVPRSILSDRGNRIHGNDLGIACSAIGSQN